ncbi:hypothetical protein ACSBR2_004607 [Camellia fascicularis]
MLEYEWGNPSTVIFSAEDSDQSRQIFDQSFNETLLHQTGFSQPHYHFHQNPTQTQTQTHTHSHFHSLYDPRSLFAPSYPPPSPAFLPPVAGPTGFVPKSEPGGGVVDFGSRIGLNLGGRTYFASSSGDDFVNRMYRRPRSVEPGSMINSPRCQAEGCIADLTHSKHYHRRHKVCEFHSKAATVVTAGLTQRFCQQCSRFHQLSEFDNGKRSCRKRLADHNRRRRKSHHQLPNHETKSQLQNARRSSSENLARTLANSEAQSSSLVTMAISPPRISLDCFRQRLFQATTTTPSLSTSSLFFSNG